ncbi:MAG: hypothetical protein L7F78_25050, partial [Syntrophales bacterium LBB04]|nr:hypothetical protein [Syntrophales bacterium LBB04]
MEVIILVTLVAYSPNLITYKEIPQGVARVEQVMRVSKNKTNDKNLQVGRKGGTAQKDLTEPYRHPTTESLMRPEVGTQAQFRKKKPSVTYRYDSSLSPALEWDGQNPAHEQGEALIAKLYDVTASLADLQAKIKLTETDRDRVRIQAEIDK